MSVPTRPEGKAYVRYWKARLEFAVQYFDAIAAVKRAATAEQAARSAQQKGDASAYREKLTEALREAQNAHSSAFHAIDTFAALRRTERMRAPWPRWRSMSAAS